MRAVILFMLLVVSSQAAEVLQVSLAKWSTTASGTSENPKRTWAGGVITDEQTGVFRHIETTAFSGSIAVQVHNNTETSGNFRCKWVPWDSDGMHLVGPGQENKIVNPIIGSAVASGQILNLGITHGNIDFGIPLSVASAPYHLGATSGNLTYRVTLEWKPDGESSFVEVDHRDIVVSTSIKWDESINNETGGTWSDFRIEFTTDVATAPEVPDLPGVFILDCFDFVETSAPVELFIAGVKQDIAGQNFAPAGTDPQSVGKDPHGVHNLFSFEVANMTPFYGEQYYWKVGNVSNQTGTGPEVAPPSPIGTDGNGDLLWPAQVTVKTFLKRRADPEITLVESSGPDDYDPDDPVNHDRPVGDMTQGDISDVINDALDGVPGGASGGGGEISHDTDISGITGDDDAPQEGDFDQLGELGDDLLSDADGAATGIIGGLEGLAGGPGLPTAFDGATGQWTFVLPIMGEIVIDLSPYAGFIGAFRALCLLGVTVITWFSAVKIIRGSSAG